MVRPSLSHPFDLALADDLGGVGTGQDRLAARFELLLEQPAGGLVELALHQRLHQVDHGHLHAAQREAMRRFEPEQAAADHYRVAALGGGGEHRVDVLHVAEADHAGQVLARHRDDERIGTGRDQQPVVLDRAAGLRRHGTIDAIDADNRIAGDQLDLILAIPFVAVDHDLVERLLAGEHRRQHDPVIVHMRFGAEDRDAVARRIAREQFLDGAAAGHAVADHHEMRTVARRQVVERLRLVARCPMKHHWRAPKRKAAMRHAGEPARCMAALPNHPGRKSGRCAAASDRGSLGYISFGQLRPIKCMMLIRAPRFKCEFRICSIYLGPLRHREGDDRGRRLRSADLGRQGWTCRPRGLQIRTPAAAAAQFLRQPDLTRLISASAATARPAKIRKPDEKLPLNCLAKPSDEAR